ncbi:hypothetical protein LINGRAHAP2_LOCUS13970 [Linum grandiflorum]
MSQRNLGLILLLMLPVI